MYTEVYTGITPSPTPPDVLNLFLIIILSFTDISRTHSLKICPLYSRCVLYVSVHIKHNHWEIVICNCIEHVHSLFQELDETVITYVKKELKRFKSILSSNFPEGLESENQEVMDPEHQKQESSARKGALKITLHILRNMNQKELADKLEKSKRLHLVFVNR